MEASRKPRVVPLIEVLEPDFDFEKWIPRKSLDDHLSAFGGHLVKKWTDRPALLDGRQLSPASRMADGRHPITFLFDESRALGNILTPVIALDNDVDYRVAVRDIHAIDQRGVVVRCVLDEALDPDFDTNVAFLLSSLGLDLTRVDIVLDLRAIPPAATTSATARRELSRVATRRPGNGSPPITILLWSWTISPHCPDFKGLSHPRRKMPARHRLGQHLIEVLARAAEHRHP